MSEPATGPSRSAHPSHGDAPDDDANNRVHHHARVGDDHPPEPDGTFTTLCGLRIKPRPEAAHMPCCPMCGLMMGNPCS
ncbi:MAG: hypothetical protein AAF480_10400 [Actinomycetota bacterium]